MKRFGVIIIAILFVFAIFAGCSKDEEDDSERSTAAEKADAQQLAVALSMMVGNIGEYDDYVGESAKSFDPPPPWQGPDLYETPDGEEDEWYWYKMAVSDTANDTLIYLLMQTPDRWADTTVTLVEKVEIWFMYKIETSVWFNFVIEVDPPDLQHISGMWKWHFEDTWLEYVFTEMGTEDYSGTIDITTSSNISLTAHFEFDIDGAGTGWGKYQGIKFVEYTFYPEPFDPYRGYYTLASEGWNVEHYF
jgi:hypothetical protein